MSLSKNKTQENLHAPGYRIRQKSVTICGNKFWADKNMIPLLRALNKAGLITRSHCEGHETGVSWVAIKTDNVTNLEIRSDGPYKEFRISWKP